MARRLIAQAVTSSGYRVSGNHVFAVCDWEAIGAGRWRASVSERPELHPARIVRAAELLARTY